MLTKEKLKELAAQLRKPEGKKGIEIAEMMNESNRSMIKHSWKHLDLQDDLRILEIGHGNAKHLSDLLRQAKGLSYCGLDISKLMHEEAKKNNQKFINQKKASFQLYDGEKIPFTDNSFARIFTVNTLYFWKNPADFLKELYRVLLPKGKLTITYGDKDFIKELPFSPFGFRAYDIHDISKIVEQTPFKIDSFYPDSEYIKSKTGEMVNRRFTTALLMKK